MLQACNKGGWRDEALFTLGIYEIVHLLQTVNPLVINNIIKNLLGLSQAEK